MGLLYLQLSMLNYVASRLGPFESMAELTQTGLLEIGLFLKSLSGLKLKFIIEYFWKCSGNIADRSLYYPSSSIGFIKTYTHIN